MHLSGGLGALTYCLNIHPATTWPEVRAAIAGPVAAVKARVSPDAPFVLGLRLANVAVEALADPGARADLIALVHDHDLLPLTVNCFPYGPFHGTRVKEEVYQPDWRTPERLTYTNALADIMADLNPDGAWISLSTVPGTFRPLGAGAEQQMADAFVDAAAHCHRVRERTGRTVAIAIEPEPFCFLETIEQSVAYFRDHLFSDRAIRRMAAATGLSAGDAADALPRHLGLCYDVCHAAVEYEDAAGSLRALRTAGVPVHKLQLSSALRIPTVTPDVRAALAPFAEPVYLHQVLSRRDGGPTAFTSDLPEALARGRAADGEEWRIHFHVPVFVAETGLFSTTQDFLAEILALHRAEPISPHLEVETYTWDVLPPGLAAGSVGDAIARELRWVRDRLDA